MHAHTDAHTRVQQLATGELQTRRFSFPLEGGKPGKAPENLTAEPSLRIQIGACQERRYQDIQAIKACEKGQ